jgi:FkbM family methyltransferase
MIAEAPTFLREFTTKRGNTVTAECRPDTTDAMTLEACIIHDEYGLAERDWSGVAVDVGAHIGGAALALLADNPDLRVVAVEALPANAELVRRNLERNFGPAEGRWKVLNAAASCRLDDVTVAYGTEGTDFESAHRFIGGAVWQDTGPKGRRVTVPAVSLSNIVGGNGFLSLVKIDCEGCEWSFLNDPAVQNVGEFRGEYHPRDGYGPARIRELLEPTHVVTLDDSQDFGPFRAVAW